MKSTTNLQSRINKIEAKIKENSAIVSELQQRRLTLGLSVFGLLVFSQIFKGFYLEVISLFLVLPIFFFYFYKSKSYQNFLNKLTAVKDFYQQQVAFANAQFLGEVAPEAMARPNLARDLDLGIFLGTIDRSFSLQGQKTLGDWICQEFGDSKLDQRKTELLQLCKLPGPLRRLHCQTSETQVDFARLDRELNRSFFEDPAPWKWIIPVAWLGFWISVIIIKVSLIWKISLFVYVASVLFYLNKTQHMFSRLQDLYGDLNTLSERFKLLENISQNLNFCQHLKKSEASKDVKRLSRLISLMSIKTNPILFYILNLIIPWDFILAEVSEKARRGFYQNFKSWSTEIIKIEAYSSLANLWFYQPTNWAEVDQQTMVTATGLAHPLLPQQSVITNDFNDQGQMVFLITGSNMSGKSTFLRALGMNFCLACIGAPVFAKSFKFKPLKIATCIRVSDSLRDGQSYFYAEVQRMKSILEEAKSSEVLFLIDEPLRGTNNRERLIGNQSYLEQILSLKARGFISTHDLELTQLADNRNDVTNYHFSDQWVDRELVFDYTIKSGPSKTTNALKILAREGLYPE